MEAIVQMVGNYGAMVVIVGLFLWDWLSNKKDIKETLKQNSECLTEIKNTNVNTAKSLELLQKSMDSQEHVMQEHDKRSIEMLAMLNGPKTK